LSSSSNFYKLQPLKQNMSIFPNLSGLKKKDWFSHNIREEETRKVRAVQDACISILSLFMADLKRFNFATKFCDRLVALESELRAELSKQLQDLQPNNGKIILRLTDNRAVRNILLKELKLCSWVEPQVNNALSQFGWSPQYKKRYPANVRFQVSLAALEKEIRAELKLERTEYSLIFGPAYKP
jgi:hypothetical protein